MTDDPSTTPGAMSPDDKNLCLLATLLAIFTTWLAPLIIWLIKKDQSPAVGDCARELLNFEITIIIAFFCGGILVPIFGLGLLVILATMIFNVVNLVLGAIAINNGTIRKYPLSLHLLK